MTKIIDICNSLIKKAKENETLQNIKFIKSYREDFAQTPIKGYMAIVNIDRVDLKDAFAGEYVSNNSKGRLAEVLLKFDLYADNNYTGENLSIKSVQLQQGLYEADENDIIQSSSISAIRYDSDLKSIFREISFNLSFCLCGEE